MTWWIPHCLPHYNDLPLTWQLDASSWMLIFGGAVGACRLSHVTSPRELIKDMWAASLIGLKYLRWTARSVRRRQGKTGRHTSREGQIISGGVYSESTKERVKTYLTFHIPPCHKGCFLIALMLPLNLFMFMCRMYVQGGMCTPTREHVWYVCKRAHTSMHVSHVLHN